MALVLLLLCSGFLHFTASSSRLRNIFYEKDTITQNHSSKLCQNKTSNLITLYDEDDAIFAFKFMKDIAGQTSSNTWTGLRQTRNNATSWSDGSNFTFSRSNVTVENGEQLCGAVDMGEWKSFNCTDRKPFMCRSRTTNASILVGERKDWCQALQHCRKHYHDLVSISSPEENEEVIARGANTSFWIGLLHDYWEWEDKGCSTFRKWTDDTDDTDDHEEKCAVQSHHYQDTIQQMKKYDCDGTCNALCSTGSMRIKVVREKKTWEEAFDYCEAHHTRLLWIANAKDQEAVEKWLEYIQVDQPLWLGLRQSRVFGFWFWSSDMTVEYQNWKDEGPPELPMSHHCGVIDKKDNYRWSDQDCQLKLPFLCEEDIRTYKK